MFIKGVVLSSYGILGYAKVRNLSNDFNDFIRLKNHEIILKKDCACFETKVEDVKLKKDALLMKFFKVNTPEKVKSLINYEIWVDVGISSFLFEDEYYFGKLIGFNIVNESKKVLARVVSFIETGNSILLEVKKENKTFLIPFLDIYLGEINDNDKTIELKVLELLR